MSNPVIYFQDLTFFLSKSIEMVKIKLGALVTDMRGSIGGMTTQHTANGIVLKKKPKLGNRKTFFNIAYDSFLNYTENARKAAFIEGQNLWKNMAYNDKEKWNIFANTFGYYGRYGGKTKYNGKQYFIAYNVRLRMHSSNYYNIPSFPTPNVPYPILFEPHFEVNNNRLYISFAKRNVTVNYRGFFYLTLPNSNLPYVRRKRFDFVTTPAANGSNQPYFLAQLFGNFPVPANGDWVKYGFIFHDPLTGSMGPFSSGLVQYNL